MIKKKIQYWKNPLFEGERENKNEKEKTKPDVGSWQLPVKAAADEIESELQTPFQVHFL